jgi:predicted ATPase/DNA-binding CsgD family transcriptional regulator/Tfp pilus assembly protein PilF
MSSASRRDRLQPLPTPPSSPEEGVEEGVDAGSSEQGGGVPAPLTSLVGRECEVGELGRLLKRADTRLVTLTGPGGVGKTRLAVQVATEEAATFADGASFVPLASIRDPTIVAATIAQALDVPVAADREAVEALIDRLHGHERLLVLDNFEQILAAAPLLTALLTACPRLTILVSSRARLHLSGEHHWPVPPLALPATDGEASNGRLGDSPAVRLFVARARAVDPDFRLTSANGATVAAICRRLDGLPLAIELAAARTRVLSPPALLARLSHRLRLLTGGPHDVPDRLRTMRAAIGWSDELLSPATRTLFRRLAVFNGGFTLEAAEGVGRRSEVGGRRSEDSGLGTEGAGVSAVMDSVAELVDGSLLRRVDGGDGESRFAMLETIREYGLEELAASGEEGATRRRHAARCLALVEQAEPGLAGPDPGPWLDRVETEHDNLRAALAWAAETGKTEIGLTLTGGLWRFWRVRGHWGEGRDWLERMLALPAAAGSVARARALNGAGVFADDQDDRERAVARFEESLALARAHGDEQLTATVITNLGDVARVRGDFDQARQLFEEALALYRQIGARPWVGMVLNNLGVLAWDRGAVEEAATQYGEALAVFRELDHRPRTADALTNLGAAAHARRELASALALATEALEIYRELGDRRGVALTLFNRGAIALDEGDQARALADLRESLLLNRDLGDRLWLARGLDLMAEAARAGGQPERAARLLGATEALREARAMPLGALERGEREAAVSRLRGELDSRAFATAWATGRVLPLEQVIDEAMAVVPAEAAAAPAPGGARSRIDLTKRERQVLRLLVAGQADKEIATALGVSRRTASKHVAAILGKLGVASRTAAATAAVRDALV